MANRYRSVFPVVEAPPELQGAVHDCVPGVPIGEKTIRPLPEELPRYRRWRVLQREAHSMALDLLPRNAIWACAKSMGAPSKGWIAAATESEQAALFDYALYCHVWRGATAVERIMLNLAERQAPSEERAIINALNESRFSLWLAFEVVPGLGVELIDVVAMRKVFIVDEGMSGNVEKGIVFGGRLMELDGFCFTSGVVTPLSSDTYIHVMRSLDPSFKHGDPDRRAYIAGRFLEPELQRMTLARQFAENAGAFEGKTRPRRSP